MWLLGEWVTSEAAFAAIFGAVFLYRWRFGRPKRDELAESLRETLRALEQSTAILQRYVDRYGPLPPDDQDAADQPCANSSRFDTAGPSGRDDLSRRG